MFRGGPGFHPLFANTYLSQKKWHLAYQEALSALTLLEQIGAPTSIAGYLYACLFNACYAWNRLEEAANWLMRLIQSAQDCQVVDLLVTGEVLGVRLALARRDRSSAQQALDRLETQVEQEGFAHHAAILNLLRVRVWLAKGQLDQARSWAAAYPTFSEDTWSPSHREELLTLVSVLLAQRHYIQADEMLSRFSRYFDQRKERLAALEWMALSVVALCHAGKHEQGEHIIAHLLSLTEPESYLRVYLDAGPLMKQALKVLKRIPHSDSVGVAAISMPSVTRILAAFEQSSPLVHHVEEHGHDGRSALRPNLDHPSALLEPLTTGEQRVLRLLVAGQTYAEIAKTLIVSPNTIKTQISSIYRKLNVGRRADAIARAEGLVQISGANRIPSYSEAFST